MKRAFLIISTVFGFYISLLHAGEINDLSHKSVYMQLYTRLRNGGPMKKNETSDESVILPCLDSNVSMKIMRMAFPLSDFKTRLVQLHGLCSKNTSCQVLKSSKDNLAYRILLYKVTSYPTLYKTISQKVEEAADAQSKGELLTEEMKQSMTDAIFQKGTSWKTDELALLQQLTPAQKIYVQKYKNW